MIDKAISSAQAQKEIITKEIKIIKDYRRSLLFNSEDAWLKKE